MLYFNLDSRLKNNCILSKFLQYNSADLSDVSQRIMNGTGAKDNPVT